MPHIIALTRWRAAEVKILLDERRIVFSCTTSCNYYSCKRVLNEMNVTFHIIRHRIIIFRK